MQALAFELEKLINQHFTGLKSIPDAALSYIASPGKWSKKEIMGHLIDSAQNNIRRFIVAQYEVTPHIVYKQDQWVARANYRQWKSEDLVDLWYLLNKNACEVLRNLPPEMAQRNCDTGELHTIEWLARDYIKHLKHHLHQVLELEPIPYP